MKEKWEHRSLCSGVEEKYSITLIDYYTATRELRFNVILSSPGHRLIVSFVVSSSYSTYIGPLRNNRIRELEKRLGKGFFHEKIFFEATNSDFLKWIYEDSCTISEGLKLKHFCFVDNRMFLDIATMTEEPEIKKIPH